MKEFFSSLRSVMTEHASRLIQHWKEIRSAAAWFVGTCGISYLAIWQSHTLGIPWGVLVASIVAIGYVCYASGLAVDRCRRVKFRVDDVEYREDKKGFFLNFTNGDTYSKVEVMVNKVTDSLDNRLTLHYAWGEADGHNPNDTLRPHQQPCYLLCRIETTASGNPGIVIMESDTNRPSVSQKKWITQDLPLEKQSFVNFDVIVISDPNMYANSPQQKTEIWVFTFMPSPGRTGGYSITKILRQPD
jgi:hypothetical protein